MKKLIAMIIIFLGLISSTMNEPNSNISPTNIFENSSISTDNSNNLIAYKTFSSQEIPKEIYQNMLGKSIPNEYVSKVDINTLSYLQISYFGFDGKSHTGEMIVNSKLANDVLAIFKELYEIRYPIEKIKLIDEYNANDELSMEDNNTSCFCYRVVAGTHSLSNHAKRMCNRYKSTI